MIRIFKLVLLLVVSQVAFGQAPSNYTNINGRYRWIAGMFDSTFHIPKGTTPSLRTGGSTNSGGLFYNTSDSSVYTYTGTQWIKLRGSLNPSDTTNKYITQVYKKSGSDSVFYVKGGTHTWAFNDSTGAPGGGGGGKIYYFNGGVNMGTFGGFTMYELGDTANTGSAANFTRATTGAIANFITDPNKPGLLQIPAGVWTIDAWLSESGGGANHAEIWAVLEKWNGSTITTIATSPIEEITEGNTPNLYTWAITVPTTTLAVTDRIIIQFYITNTNGKTVTLYTQNGYVGEVHTTFTTGIGALNGLSAPAQYLVTGTSGTDFNISSVTATHTFNLPTASATNRGALSSADWTTFNNKISPADTASMLSPYLRKIDTASLSNRINLKVNISDTASMLNPYLRKVDTASLSNRINLKVNISDTASMLSPYLRKIDTASLSNRINLKVNISDTANMLNPYLRKVDTASLSNRINTKLNISDTATMLGNYVNNVGYGLSKVSQVVSADSATLASYFLRRKDSLTATNLLGYVTGKILADTAAAVRAAAGAGTIGGSGTANRVSKFTASGTIGNSSIVDSSSSVAMSISSAGNIGVGITPSNWATNYKAFQFNNTSLATFTGLNEQANLALNWYADSGGDKYYANGASSLYQQSNGNHFFYTAPTGTANNSITFSQRFGVYNDGKVAVGLTSSDSLFSVTQGVHLQRGVRLSGLPTGVGTKALRIDANGTLSIADTTTGGGIGGSGTTNYLPKFSASTTLADSRFLDNGTVTFLGNGETNGTPSTAIFSATGGTGSNIAGAEMRIRGGASTGSGAGGPITFYTSAAGSAGTSTNAATEVMRIAGSTTAAKVGIGTTGNNTYQGLTIRGSDPSLRFETSNANGWEWIEFVTSAGTNNFSLGVNQTSPMFGIKVGAGMDNMNFNLNSSGNFGLGTNTIGSRLQVNGNAAIGYSASTAAPTNGLAVAGNVGVGTINPLGVTNYTALDIRGTTGGLLEMGNTSNQITGRFVEIEATASIAKLMAFNSVPLVLGTEGAERFRINTSGIAFIGNGETASSPSTGIISGTGGTGTNVAGAEFRIRGGASTGSGAGGPITFYTSAAGSAGTGVNAATERMRLDASGNLGLGVTPSAWGTVLKAFDIGTSGSLVSSTSGAGGLSVARNGYYNGSVWVYKNTSTAQFYEQDAGQHAWYTAPSGTAGNTISFTQVMTLTASGNLGIGTTTIGSKLQVNGNAAIGYSASTAAPTNGLAVSGNVGIGTNSPVTNLQAHKTTAGISGLQVTNSTTGSSITDGAFFGIDDSNTYLWNYENNPTLFGTNNSERMRISSAGLVGIGTTSPSGRLHIDPADNEIGLNVSTSSLTGSNAQSLIDLAQTWNTTGNPTAIKLNITNTASGATANLMDLQVGGTSEFKVTKAGYVGINQGTPTSMLHTQGSVATAYSSKTATYTLTGDDHTVLFNAVGAAANLTANLPDATTCTGRIYVIIGVVGGSTTNVTIDGNGTQTIGGSQTYTFWNACETYGTLIIQSDGSNWQILSQYIESSGC